MTGLLVGLTIGIMIGVVIGWFGLLRGRSALSAVEDDLAARPETDGGSLSEPPEQRAARRHLEQELEREPEPGTGEVDR